MELKLYLVKNKLTVNEFSETLNYSRTHLSAIINGRLSPSKKLAKMIQKATNGEVKVEELMKEIEKKETPKSPSKTTPKGWVMEKSVFDK